MPTSRRTFLATATAAGLGFHFLPRHVLGGQPGKNPPSRKLNIASVGAGGQAAGDLGAMASENIVALCDVDDRRAAGMYQRHPQAKRYKDFRKMLDEMSEKIDAVLVGTPDHTHAVAALAAIQRGKHVYCEKPLAHSVAEVRALRKAAAEKKVITQVGNQGHSSDSIRVFCEWIWDGAIGDVTEVHAGCNAFPDTYCRIGRLEAVARERPPVPAEVDWDLWQGPVAARPYHDDYLPWNWRGWSPYGGGTLGDWVCHVVDPVFWALDLDMPTTVKAEVDGWDPAKQGDTFPVGSQITFEFAAKGKRGPVKLVWYDGKRQIPRPAELEGDRRGVGTGAVVIGKSGKIVYGSHGAGGCRLIPEEKMKTYKRPEPKIPRVRGGHQQDWLAAIREGRPAGSPFEYGGRLSEIGLLGVVALRVPGEELRYDEQAARFTNNDEANRWLNPPYRDGWKLA
jgi:predicted dehydrogenase